MIEAMGLDRHLMRYGTEYLGKVLKQISKQQILEQLTFYIRHNMLVVTCKNDESYQALKQCETLLDKDTITKLGLRCFIFEYDQYFLVLNIIEGFRNQGLTEFSFQSVFEKFSAYYPAKTAQAIKDTLDFFANDFSDDYRKVSWFSSQFLQLRGLKPLIKRQNNNTYLLLPKTKLASIEKFKLK